MPPSEQLLPTRFLGARLTPALTLTESGFLFCARDGETYSLNKTGACLFQALQDGVPPLDAWRTLVQRFDVPPPLAQRDAQLFLGRLFGLGLLELPSARDGDDDHDDGEHASGEGHHHDGEVRR